jgi:hypothetical protein
MYVLNPAINEEPLPKENTIPNETIKIITKE